jgi:chitinase
MKPSDIDTSVYNYVHYAFGSITADFQVDVSAYPDMFTSFVNLTGTKRIMSFGGWSFSTDADTSPIFRSGVTDAQRVIFAKSLLDFVTKYNLDGLDFDWEYPGATDIKRAEPGTPQDGANYLAFLKIVKASLPAGKTLSIAAPASYWYLRGFPIAEISTVVDYIVYMTYDLHGQWDYGNTFVNEDCANGNCLRAHTNFTETYYAMSMITKAGVPLNKIVIGMARYGRSFEMAVAGCTGPQCLFTGPESGAAPGPCTNTSGYISNYEINQIINQLDSPDLYGNLNISMFKDHTGDAFPNDGYSSLLSGDILVYDDTQWVSYMSEVTYADRLFYWADYNIGGAVDWAVDLVFDFSQGSGSDGSDDGDQGDTSPCNFTKSYNTLDDVVAALGSITKQCAEIFTVQTLSNELSAALANYTSVDNDYDKLFGYYVEAIKAEVPNVLSEFMDSVDGPGNKYFQCTWQELGVNSTVQTCPFDQLSLGNPGYKCFFELQNSTGFYEDLSTNYGISAEWVAFGEKKLTGLQQNEGGVGPPSYWEGFPDAAGDITPTNPKDIVTAALPNMTMLQSTIDSTWMNQMLGQWDGSGTDPAQVLAMPIALIQQAIDSMAQVKVIGSAQSDADRKKLILEIITAVLVVVPFVGGLGADIAGLAELSSAIALIGELSNTALDIYSIVDDPASAPMVIFGDLLGLGVIGGAVGRGEQEIEKLGKLRRGMTAGEVSKLGSVFSAQTAKIDKIIGKCS